MSTVKAQIPCAREAEAQLHPRPPPGLHLAERHTLELRRVAARVRGAVVAPIERVRSVEPRIAAAAGIEQAEARAPGLPIRVGGIDLQGIEVIGGVVWSQGVER